MFHYENNILKFFATAEGYVNVTMGERRPNPEVYNYKDHLGNIRLSYTNTLSGVTILEENHYYPFGLKHKKYGSVDKDFIEIEGEGGYYVGIDIVPPQTRKPYQYKLNGKEWQDELDLNVYAMDLRQYDPAIARWTVMDPVIHHSMSPYNAFDNNPVYWADPSGGSSISFGGNSLFGLGLQYNWNEGYYTFNGLVLSGEGAMGFLSALDLSGDGSFFINTDVGISEGDSGTQAL